MLIIFFGRKAFGEMEIGMALLLNIAEKSSMGSPKKFSTEELNGAEPILAIYGIYSKQIRIKQN